MLQHVLTFNPSLLSRAASAAKRAKLDPAKVHAEYLERKPGFLATLVQDFGDTDDEDAGGGDAFAHVAADRRQMLARAVGDMKRLATSGSIQARCLECGGMGPTAAGLGDAGAAQSRPRCCSHATRRR